MTRSVGWTDSGWALGEVRNAAWLVAGRDMVEYAVKYAGDVMVGGESFDGGDILGLAAEIVDLERT